MNLDDFTFSSYQKDWQKVEGPWILTNKVRKRFMVAFRFSPDEVEEILRKLEAEDFSKVPERNPHPNGYKIQLLVNHRCIWLSVAHNTKILTFAMSPLFHFDGAYDAEPAVDYGMDEDTVARSWDYEAGPPPPSTLALAVSRFVRKHSQDEPVIETTRRIEAEVRPAAPPPAPESERRVVLVKKAPTAELERLQTENAGLKEEVRRLEGLKKAIEGLLSGELEFEEEEAPLQLLK